VTQPLCEETCLFTVYKDSAQGFTSLQLNKLNMSI